jgi:hypothetical protein
MMGFVMAGEARAIIAGATVYAEAAVEADTKLWTELQTGQDSEEAEASGTLTGYAEAFRAVHNMLTYGDKKDVEGLIESLKTTAEQAEMELAEYGAEPDLEPTAGVTVVFVDADVVIVDGLAYVKAAE